MITSSLNVLIPKKGEYNTYFSLYPRSTQAPIFNVDPIDNLRQFTWISQITYDTNANNQANGRIITFKEINGTNTTIGMLEGTEFEIDIQAYDPTNLIVAQDDSNLDYRWKKDGSTLVEFSAANNMKGVSRLYITSESCTRDISGEYTLEATNKFGTSTTTAFNIDVINLKYHPALYKNLLVNGCGEFGLNNWTTDSDITIKQFSTNNRNQGSIPLQVYSVNYTTPYTKDFRFSFHKNETKLSAWFNLIQTPSTFNIPSDPGKAEYNKWIIKNFKPNLVATDGSDSINVAGPHESFFPSWNYIDKYNKNDKLIQLDNIISKHKTYITRDKIRFAKYNGKAKSIAYQTIDVSNASNMIDGQVYGVDRIMAHFFAYVGIGISSYKIEYMNTNNETVVDNMIPTSFYDYKVGSLNDKPPFIPLHPSATFFPNAATTYNTNKRDQFATSIRPGTRINLIPVCYDLTDIRLDFLDGDQQLIESIDVPGPTDRDIWAVKEKFFIPMHIANLYGWCTTADRSEFWINNQAYTTVNSILQLSNEKDLRAEYVKQNIYPFILNPYEFGRRTDDIISIEPLPSGSSNELQEVYYKNRDLAVEKYGFNPSFVEINGTTKLPLWTIDGLSNIKYDEGAAAFFGINQNVELPFGTRSIRVNIIFNHTSDTMYDENPKSKGWSNQTIYYDVFSKAEAGERLYEYGNPRCGVTAMHLSLHPNVVKVSEDYNTYYTHISGSVWGSELLRLQNVGEQSSVVPKATPLSSLVYKYSLSTIPTDYNYAQQEPININDLDQIAGTSNALITVTGSEQQIINNLLPSQFTVDFGAIGESSVEQISNAATTSSPTGSVPDVVGLTRFAARVALQSEGLTMTAISGSDPNVQADVGRVESQFPAAGSFRPSSNNVTVYVYGDFPSGTGTGPGGTGNSGGGGNRPTGPQ